MPMNRPRRMRLAKLLGVELAIGVVRSMKKDPAMSNVKSGSREDLLGERW